MTQTERRTDLAVEERELLGEDIKGVRYSKEEIEGLPIERLHIGTQRAGQLLKKPVGTYITVELPPLTDSIRDTDSRVKALSEEIRRLLPVNGLVLIAGLGNVEITPDALGPKAASKVLATRHIQGEIARSTGLDKLRAVAVVNTGVTGQTGIETGELLQGVIKNIRPSAVIAVDALASRRLERLGCTVQISDTGIAPGAGVGNRRIRIDQDTMGVPVIAVGVPTVVDALTLAFDLLDISDEKEGRELSDAVSPQGRSMVVTPKEIDLLIDRAAHLISLAINMALQTDIDTEDLLDLL
ncbi:MAG: GPR endopeptidase [Ruminococcus sp.]|nr:GPR endopeptidase [uncultured Ruminococcus sp.]MBQ1474934.1 GPR endopeptidase [Ruminococcus sp.]MBQ4238734.1 GPR endopeptidase [Ruminococcus sp.]MBQ6413841.1 GPR endopeptidase [Ruminococcus sp.]